MFNALLRVNWRKILAFHNAEGREGGFTYLN